MSERRVCQLANQPRGTQRYQPTQREDEDRLTQAIITLASQYGRYVYRRLTALADVMVLRGVPEHLRSDNGPEFVAKGLRKWLAATGAKTLYIEPGSPRENGYCESFNSKLRDDFLNGEIFYSLKELRVLAERWRVHYNTVRPHSSLGYRPHAPKAWLSEASQGHGKVESKERFPLFHAPRLLRRVISLTRRATLTIALVQNIGQARRSRQQRSALDDRSLMN